MEWIVNPIDGLYGLVIPLAAGCCHDRTYAGPCRLYASCSGTATLVVSLPDTTIPQI